MLASKTKGPKKERELVAADVEAADEVKWSEKTCEGSRGCTRGLSRQIKE
jgi:hypothetical protein